MKKIFNTVILCFLIAFLIIAALDIFIGPKKVIPLVAEESANHFGNGSDFFIYENNQAGLSIKYPKNWQKQEFSSAQPSEKELTPIVLIREPLPSNGKTLGSGIIIQSLKISANSQTSSELYKKYAKEYVKEDKNNAIVSSDETMFLGIPAYKVRTKTQVTNSNKESFTLLIDNYLVIKNNFLYIVQQSDDPQNFEKKQKNVYSILTTINLDYKNQIDGDFATYENKDFGIKFKYPKGWIQSSSNPQYGFITRLFNPKESSNHENRENIGIRIADEQESSPSRLKDTMIKSWRNTFDEFQMINENNIFMSNEKGFEVLFSYLQNDGTRIKEFSASTLKNGKSYTIDIFPVETLSESQIDTIVASFEFLKS